MTVINKSGRLSETTKTLFQIIYQSGRNSGKTRLYIFHQAGRGTRTRYTLTDTGRGLEALDYFAIRYRRGNDSPRGGKLGEYIELTPRAVQQVRMILEAYSLPTN